MPRASILAKSLREQRWQIAGFGFALGAMAMLVVFLWPAYRDSLAQIELPPAIEALLGADLAFGTGAGFINAEFFSWIPVLLITYATIQGTAAIAGEEGSGTMDLLLAQPVSRTRAVLEKCAACAIGSIIIVAMGFLGFAFSVPFVDIGVSVGDTAVACANLLPITLLSFAIGLWAGAVAPTRGVASGLAIALATAGYFLNTVSAGVEALSWLRYVTPFYYYGAGGPLVHGINWPHVGLLLGVTAALVALAIRTFEARDVTVGGAPGLPLRALFRRALGQSQ